MIGKERTEEETSETTLPGGPEEETEGLPAGTGEDAGNPSEGPVVTGGGGGNPPEDPEEVPEETEGGGNPSEGPERSNTSNRKWWRKSF